MSGKNIFTFYAFYVEKMPQNVPFSNALITGDLNATGQPEG